VQAPLLVPGLVTAGRIPALAHPDHGVTDRRELTTELDHLSGLSTPKSRFFVRCGLGVALYIARQVKPNTYVDGLFVEKHNLSEQKIL